jgi:hypothetical protein
MTDNSKKPIPITEEECVHLIRESKNGRSVQLTIPGGALMITDGNLWALEEIAKLRGIDVGDT